MITCSTCGEMKKQSAFYTFTSSKKKRCKRCHQGINREAMRGKPQQKEEPRPMLPELLALHGKEKALDTAWITATQNGKHERAERIREKYNKVDAQITRMMKGTK